MYKPNTISVVIPVYNGEKTLKACLSSVISQTKYIDEIIVVDNNSTDSTKKIIQQFSKDSASIIYLFEQKKTRGAARNAGIKRAKSDIIVMTDSDCVTPLNWVNDIALPIRTENEVIVMGSQTSRQTNYWARHIQQQQENFIEKFRTNLYVDFLDTKNIAFKASIIKEYLFNSTQVTSEDFELMLRLKEKIRFLPTLKVEHQHPDTLIAWVKNTFQKGFWTEKVYELHKNDKNIIEHPMFAFIKKKDFLHFFLIISREAIECSLTKAYFDFITGLSWRAGLYYGELHSNYHNEKNK